MTNFLPHTEADRRKMLDAIGRAEAELLPGGRLDAVAPWPASGERDLLAEVAALAQPATTRRAGEGVGAFFIPAVVDALAGRGEFVTAYTPYQPEAAQGTLAAIFEFQTRVCELTGLEVSNAGLYDGASAAAEAATMALAETGRREILVARSVAPRTRETLATLLAGRGMTLREIPFDPESGELAGEAAALIAGSTAAVLVQSPNAFGVIEPNLAPLFAVAHDAGALAIQVFHPLAVTLFGRPAESGADIAVAEGQPLGIPLSGGGPYLGLMAAKEKLVRRLPGRIVGRTLDAEGRPAYVLTLQTREQHIRRERATSNICSNQALMALRVVIYLAALGGWEGLKSEALAVHVRAKAAASGRAVLSGEIFNEFVIEPAETATAESEAEGLPLDYAELPGHRLAGVA